MTIYRKESELEIVVVLRKLGKQWDMHYWMALVCLQ